jgi:hypothetical protein
VSIDLEGTVCDAEAARLLPWLVTGTLSAADTERVQSHLERCEICRADLAHERRLRTWLKADGRVEYAPQAGLAKTLARIDELMREAPPAARDDRPVREHRPARRRFTVSQWLTAAVVVQAIGLGVLGGSVLSRSAAERASARYQTLSSPAAVAGGTRIRAVFTPSMTISELKALLGTQRLMIVAGPSDAGVFTLGAIDAQLDRSGVDALLAGLRTDRHVLFAEPASGDAVAPR